MVGVSSLLMSQSEGAEGCPLLVARKLFTSSVANETASAFHPNMVTSGFKKPTHLQLRCTPEIQH